MLCEALVHMVNDSSHCVRMHMATVVAVLYYSRTSSKWVELGMGPLLPRAEQEEVFQQVTKMLQKAYQVSVSSTE